MKRVVIAYLVFILWLAVGAYSMFSMGVFTAGETITHSLFLFLIYNLFLVLIFLFRKLKYYLYRKELENPKYRDSPGG